MHVKHEKTGIGSFLLAKLGLFAKVQIGNYYKTHMPEILIASPDIETRQMLELAFELEGLKVRLADNPLEILFVQAESDAIIIDLIEDTDEQWKMARSALSRIGRKTGRKTPKSILILPRSRKGGALPKEFGKTSLIVQRPFELVDFVKQTSELARQKTKAPSLSKRPSRRK